MKNTRILNIIITILLIISVLSGGMLALYGYSLRQAGNEFEALAKTFQASQVKLPQAKDAVRAPLVADEVIEEAEVSVAFEDLYHKNSDIVAWITIAGTGVNYPVMHTPKKPDYYLYRNFEKEYSVSGVPFLDGKSSLDPATDNLLIHGHNMKNGSMFAQLLAYQDEAFLQAHPSIELYTLDGKSTYDIMSVFPTSANKNDAGFDYHNFIQAKDEEAFNQYVAKAKERTLFETGLEAQYGDQLMTLSTCAYHTANGRFVVVAKQRIK